MKLRCIIVDDEYLARQRLIHLLKDFENVLIVGECRNGKEALDKIHIKEPDLIFLDIQMPDMDGITVLSKLKVKPFVIFTTAYDNYALKAFEINAVDYLLKPFDEERLEIAVNRVRDRKNQEKESDIEEKIKKVMQTYRSAASTYLSEINIKLRGKIIKVFVDDVVYFNSDGNYLKIFTDSKSYLYRKTMNSLYEDLNKDQFLRIHRSIIVNKTYIESVIYLGNNEYKFKMKNREELTSSRSYKSIISEYVSDY